MLKLLPYLKRYRTAVAIVLLLVFIQSLAELYLPRLMADIVDFGVINGDTAYIWKIGGVMLAVALAGGLSSVGASYLSSRAAGGFGRDVRSRLFNHVSKFSLQEFDHIGTSSLITRTTNDITQVQNVLTMMMRVMVMAPLMSIGGVIMSIYTDVKLSFIFIIVIPLLAAIIAVVAMKSIPLFRQMQLKIDQLNLILRENLLGVRVIRAFNRTTHEQARFDVANEDYTSQALRVNRLMGSLMPIMMLIMNLTTIAIVWFGSKRIAMQGMEVGDLIAFIQYAWQIMFSLIFASMMFVMIPRAAASATRINEVLELQATVIEPEQPMTVATTVPATIEFDNVTFSYPGAEMPAIQNISFTAQPGQMTAIIGGTGSGKSTLLNLMLRMYDVSHGQIKLRHQDIRQYSQHELREQFAYVPQKALLFTGTVADNIRYGKEDATMEQVVYAAEIAQASEFIAQLPNQYEDVISQGGTNLSGGQKQRLSIARAIVKQPAIYLFDDSFSALDYKTDAQLRQALQAEIASRTMIVVAQRVSTVLNADQIIVMDEGRIVGIGTHRELLATCTIYREIVQSQLSEEELG